MPRQPAGANPARRWTDQVFPGDYGGRRAAAKAWHEWDEWTLDYRHPNNPVGQMISSGDWYQYVLTRPIDAQPGQKFAYGTGVSSLMSRMIRSSTGLSPRKFAMQGLFEPLGIDTIQW